MGLHLRSRRLQSCSAAEASGGLGLKAPANCRLIGRWRIVEADLWDRAHLDLCGPATLTITARGGKSPSAPWRPVSKSNMRATRSASSGPDAKMETKWLCHAGGSMLDVR